MQAIKNAAAAITGGNEHSNHSGLSSGSEQYQSVSTHHHHGEVVGERPVAVGVAEVPVVVTEQERMSTHHHHHEGLRTHEEVCGQKTFTEVEDRPVVRERVERIMEHRPVEKQYVVETRYVGERELGTSHTEVVDVKERIVEVAQPGPTCPANTGAIMNEVVSSVTGGTHMTGTHMGGRI